MKNTLNDSLYTVKVFEEHKRVRETKSILSAELNYVFNKILYVLPYDLYDIFNEYCYILIKHLNEINQDQNNVNYLKGFRKGVEFERYLKNKHSK